MLRTSRIVYNLYQKQTLHIQIHKHILTHETKEINKLRKFSLDKKIKKI